MLNQRNQHNIENYTKIIDEFKYNFEDVQDLTIEKSTELFNAFYNRALFYFEQDKKHEAYIDFCYAVCIYSAHIIPYTSHMIRFTNKKDYEVEIGIGAKFSGIPNYTDGLSSYLNDPNNFKNVSTAQFLYQKSYRSAEKQVANYKTKSECMPALPEETLQICNVFLSTPSTEEPIDPSISLAQIYFLRSNIYYTSPNLESAYKDAISYYDHIDKDQSNSNHPYIISAQLDDHIKRSINGRNAKFSDLVKSNSYLCELVQIAYSDILGLLFTNKSALVKKYASGIKYFCESYVSTHITNITANNSDLDLLNSCFKLNCLLLKMYLRENNVSSACKEILELTIILKRISEIHKENPTLINPRTFFGNLFLQLGEVLSQEDMKLTARLKDWFQTFDDEVLYQIAKFAYELSNNQKYYLKVAQLYGFIVCLLINDPTKDTDNSLTLDVFYFNEKVNILLRNYYVAFINAHDLLSNAPLDIIVNLPNKIQSMCEPIYKIILELRKDSKRQNFLQQCFYNSQLYAEYINKIYELVKSNMTKKSDEIHTSATTFTDSVVLHQQCIFYCVDFTAVFSDCKPIDKNKHQVAVDKVNSIAMNVKISLGDVYKKNKQYDDASGMYHQAITAYEEMVHSSPDNVAYFSIKYRKEIDKCTKELSAVNKLIEASKQKNIPAESFEVQTKHQKTVEVKTPTPKVITAMNKETKATELEKLIVNKCKIALGDNNDYNANGMMFKVSEVASLAGKNDELTITITASRSVLDKINNCLISSKVKFSRDKCPITDNKHLVIQGKEGPLKTLFNKDAFTSFLKELAVTCSNNAHKQTPAAKNNPSPSSFKAKTSLLLDENELAELIRVFRKACGDNNDQIKFTRITENMRTESGEVNIRHGILIEFTQLPIYKIHNPQTRITESYKITPEVIANIFSRIERKIQPKLSHDHSNICDGKIEYRGEIAIFLMIYDQHYSPISDLDKDIYKEIHDKCERVPDVEESLKNQISPSASSSKTVDKIDIDESKSTKPHVIKLEQPPAIDDKKLLILLQNILKNALDKDLIQNHFTFSLIIKSKKKTTADSNDKKADENETIEKVNISYNTAGLQAMSSYDLNLFFTAVQKVLNEHASGCMIECRDKDNDNKKNFTIINKKFSINHEDPEVIKFISEEVKTYYQDQHKILKRENKQLEALNWALSKTDLSKDEITTLLASFGIFELKKNGDEKPVVVRKHTTSAPANSSQTTQAKENYQSIMKRQNIFTYLKHLQEISELLPFDFDHTKNIPGHKLMLLYAYIGFSIRLFETLASLQIPDSAFFNECRNLLQHYLECNDINGIITVIQPLNERLSKTQNLFEHNKHVSNDYSFDSCFQLSSQIKQQFKANISNELKKAKENTSTNTPKKVLFATKRIERTVTEEDNALASIYDNHYMEIKKLACDPIHKPIQQAALLRLASLMPHLANDPNKDIYRYWGHSFLAMKYSKFSSLLSTDPSKLAKPKK